MFYESYRSVSEKIFDFVDLSKIEVSDEQKKLTFPVLVMYPTRIPPKSVTFGPFILDVSVDAEIGNGKFPLVVIFHGSGGSNLTHRMLGAHLAKSGFVVCIPEHLSNSSFGV